MLGDFELRGTSADIERLAEIIVNTQKESETYPRIMSLGCLTFLFSMITLSTLRRLGL